MTKSQTVYSIGYWFSAYTLGLLIHPYKTAREIITSKSSKLLFFSPLVLWLIFFIIGFIGLRFGWVILWLLGLRALPRFINLLAFLFWWLTYFMALWQLLLFYLFLRFKKSFSKAPQSTLSPNP